MKPFFLFDFFQNAGKRAALGFGSLLLILGVLILFFPELLRTLIGLILVSGSVPLLAYGMKDDFWNKRTPPSNQGPPEDVRIIYQE